MAKREYSNYQRGLIKRYYEHKDSLMSQKLSEIVSELYLCTDEKKAKRLWASAHKALLSAGVVEARAAKTTEARDLEGLAKLVTELF